MGDLTVPTFVVSLVTCIIVIVAALSENFNL